MPGSSSPRVSVIVPSYNSGTTIRRCLDSLLAQRTDISFEIIVADSSTDDTPDIVRSYETRVSLVRSDRQLFPGPARNLGIARSRGGILAFTDADCIVDPGWIDAVVRAHDSHDAVGGRILNGTPASLAGTALYLCEFIEFAAPKARSFSSIPSCNISYKRTLLEQLGGFPEVPWGEEYILNNRIPGGVRFVPGMVVRHVNRTAFSETVGHARKVGFGCALSRRETGQAEFLFRYRVLIPLLWAWRLGKIAWSSVRAGQAGAFLRSAPLLLVDLWAWTAGFFAGSAEFAISDWSMP